jgi:hypothetical protein
MENKNRFYLNRVCPLADIHISKISRPSLIEIIVDRTVLYFEVGECDCIDVIEYSRDSKHINHSLA